MKRLFFACALAACATPPRAESAATVAPLPAPISQASDGQLQCYGPHRATRTCQALAAYARTKDGHIDNRADILVERDPLVVARTTTTVRVLGDAVCGAIREADLAAATFTVADRPASAEETSVLRDHLRASMRRLFDHEICTAYVPRAGTLRAHVTLDGVAQEGPEEEVIWVAPTEGWRVGAEGVEP